VSFNEDVLGVVGTKEEMADAWKDFIQNELDFKQKLNTLPGGSPENRDPDRTTDPAKPWIHWSPSAIDGGGNLATTDLVGRTTVVDWVVWDTDEQKYNARTSRVI
jgi:hypothetical protein